LADTVPALVGAIEEANGKSKAEHFILDFILAYLHGQDLLEIWPLHTMDINLNQYLKNKGQPECEPRILHKSAVETLEPCFIVGLYQGDDHRLIGESPGESPAIARKMAELDALRNLFGLTIAENRLLFGPKAYNLDLSKFDKENFRIFGSPSQKQNKQQVSN